MAPTTKLTQEETELITGLKRGDNEAFENLQLIYNSRMFAVANSCLGVYKGEASDVVQETWIKVFGKINQFNGSSSLYTWMVRIIKNICFDRHRKFKVRKFDTMESIENGAALALADGDDSPLRFSEKQELARLINARLLLLDETTRRMIILRFGEGYKSNEAARILNLGDSTAKVKVFRGLAKLRKIIPHDLCPRSSNLA